jgi:acyl CoA:acetate/3-ketoacid CoA transferase beta subunit
VFDVDPNAGLTLLEIREDYTVEKLIELTEAKFNVSPDLKPLQQA